MGLGERRVKIVCTLGPATAGAETLAALIRAGMDVARLNFSHGSHAAHARMLGDLRRAARIERRPVAVLADLQGPRVRVGALPGGAIELLAGETVRLATEDADPDGRTLPVTITSLPGCLRVGDRVLLVDGTRALRVTREGERVCEAVVEVGGAVRSHQGINVPGRELGIGALTEKDRRDLAFACRQGVDYVALSFVSTPEDVLGLKARLRELGSGARVVVKFELAAAVARLEEIVDAADEVMVARGDMGVELPIEQVPATQKRLIRACNARGKAVITATQMLQSMVEQPSPTRAEATDVVNAVLDGTDAVMLSGETAAGRYPVLAVETMARLIRAAEELSEFGTGLGAPAPDATDAVAQAAVELARDLDARAILALTENGGVARRLSAHRPSVPVIAATPRPATAGSLCLPWGVIPLLSPRRRTTGALAAAAIATARAAGLLAEGDRIVLTAGLPLGGSGSTNLLKVQLVGQPVL
ncbi:MAG TPA: pyruvate kinase [Chloroflexota bacterium]